MENGGEDSTNERFDLDPEDWEGFRPEVLRLLKQLIHFGRFKITSWDLSAPLPLSYILVL